jgi:DsbC/DsbD-like thiol-disulfide interchange protein
MITSRPRVRQAAVFAASLAIASAMNAPGRAADASSWDGDQRSNVRLIAGTAVSEPGARILRGGIELKLGPGWKTYWRYPGEAGMPPSFDFTGSENVKAITMLWPAPQRFSDAHINLIAYKGDVILPLRIVPQNEDKQVTLRLKVDYGICAKLCMLAEAKVDLVLSGNESSHEGALAAAEARVPKQVALGQGGSLAIRAVRREAGPTGPRVIVDIAAADPSRVDLFAEGPTPEWTLPLPEPIAAEAGLRRFALDLTDVPSDPAPKGLMLKFTAVADEDAIEVSTPVD